MTSQAPIPKPTGVAALLLALPGNPTPPQNAAPPEDFLATILKAITAKSKSADSKLTTPAPKPSDQKTTLRNDEETAQMAAAANLILNPLPSAPLSITNGKFSMTNCQSEPVSEAPTKPPVVSRAVPGPTVKSASVAQSIPGAPAIQTPATAKDRPTATATENASPAPIASSVDKPPAIPSATPPLAVPPRRGPIGTPAAKDSTRMTFVAERNEIAGRTEQNVPTDRISSVSAASGSGDSSSSPKGGAKLSVDFSARDLPAENLPILDVSGKLAAPTPITTAPPVAAAAPTQHLEKLEQMISQEAVNIRQTGDNSIGVSLQIDGQTRLFLQLTQQNGQIQATLQCEKGSFSASDPQWAALQQSLAGQNVQLTAPASGSAQFGSTGENQQRSLPSRDDSTTSNGFGVPGARQRQPRNQNGSRQNWESWA